MTKTLALLEEFPYKVDGFASETFVGGNCTDFTYEAWELLADAGFTNLKEVVLAKGDLTHMVLLINDMLVFSVGSDAQRILTPSYFNEWDEVYISGVKQ